MITTLIVDVLEIGKLYISYSLWWAEFSQFLDKMWHNWYP